MLHAIDSAKDRGNTSLASLPHNLRSAGIGPVRSARLGFAGSSLDPAEVPAALNRLEACGIRSAHIGEIVPAGQGRILNDGDRSQALPTFSRDELGRYLE